jgi:RHS repeat-associated protein
VLTATDTVNGAWTYTYDTLNRLSTGKSSTTGLSWTYDAFGNRKTQTATLGSAPQPSFSFSTTTNRIDGFCYDAAGNLLDAASCPTGSVHQFAYDGEGKLISSKSGAYTYEYDGDGYRIAKLASGAVTDVYFYDVAGREVVDTDSAFNVRRAEIFAANRHLATYNGTAVYFNHGNWLGTETAHSDSTAALCETESNLPFGESVTTTGTCTPTVDFYTGKLRDSESGDDYFGARYYTSTDGRWVSPDPSNLGVDIYMPQTWNRYNYAVNNPLAVADRNGMWPFYIHQQIIDDSFPGMSKKDLQSLKDASWNMDYGPGQQDPSNSYMHGMSDGSGNVFWGGPGGNAAHDQIQADEYIDSQVQIAQQAQADWEAAGNTGFSPAALQAFGNALHTVTDRTSPAHEGEQPWANKPKWHYTTIWHFLREAWPTPSRRNAANDAAQALLLRTFGNQFAWVFFKNPCARTAAVDSQGNGTGWSGCQ